LVSIDGQIKGLDSHWGVCSNAEVLFDKNKVGNSLIFIDGLGQHKRNWVRKGLIWELIELYCILVQKLECKC